MQRSWSIMFIDSNPKSLAERSRFFESGWALSVASTWLAALYGTLGIYWKPSVNGETMNESSKVNGPWLRSKRMPPVLVTMSASLQECQVAPAYFRMRTRGIVDRA